MIEKPKLDDAPGITWKPRKDGFEARWQCRTDLVERGYRPKTVRILRITGTLTEDEGDYVRARCKECQGDMLAWTQKGLPVVTTFDGTIGGLMAVYRGDKDSPYNKKLRYRTRRFYDAIFQSLKDLTWHDEYGLERKLSMTRVAEIKGRLIITLHGIYVDREHIAMGHQAMGILRMLFGYGAAMLEDIDCARLCIVLGKMKFPMSKPRTEILTADMATMIRAEATRRGLKSIALAQAFQFDGMLRQKDVIGEWVPANEKRVPFTDVISGGDKWIRGLRWEEIDANMMLRHVTSKRLKEITLNLRYMPMVMEELGNPLLRGQLPAKGPIIVNERLREPWFMTEYRRKWREIADAVGVPRTVKNMDSRAGAITEATQSGAPLESIKHAATHSDISMTQRYARAAETKTEDVQRFRMNHRNKSGS